MSGYIPTIGLEVHCELKTATKLFCSCRNEFGAAPNTNTCPVCAGHPGVLPVLNRKAVEYTVKAGCAIGCRISRYSKWDRKNYFYPDLPKAWQTSQYDLPLCIGGEVKITVGGVEKTVRLNRIHLEEDAGKLVHGAGSTAVDYNRCAIAIGSEGRGLTEGVLALCDRTIKIPMSEHCESLNAAAAATVLLWEAARND